MGHNHHPHVPLPAPRLKPREHLLDLQRLALDVVVSLDEEIGIHIQEMHRLPPHGLLAQTDDGVGGGTAGAERNIHHMTVKTRHHISHLVGREPVEFGSAEGNAHERCQVLGLVGLLERAEAHALLLMEGEMRHEAAAPVGLAAVGLARHDYQPALVGEPEVAVGKLAEARAVAVVIQSVEHVEHLAADACRIDELAAVGEAGGIDGLLHRLLALGGKQVGDVLVAVGQASDSHRLAVLVVEIVPQRVHHIIAWLVLVVAYYHAAHGLEPFHKRLHIRVGLCLCPVGHGYDIPEPRRHERADVLLALGDDERDAVGVAEPFGPEAVDVVGRYGQHLVGDAPLQEFLFVDGAQLDVGHLSHHCVHVCEALPPGLVDILPCGLASKHLGAECKSEGHDIIDHVVVGVEVHETVNLRVVNGEIVGIRDFHNHQSLINNQ